MSGLLRSAIFALALTLAAPLTAQQVLNLRDADIRAFIQDVARVTGRTFIIDPRVQGKVSVVTDRALSRSEYFEVFLSTLRANGLVAVPSGSNTLRIQPADGMSATGGVVGTRAMSANSFLTEVFRLRTIDAASAAETLKPLISKDGSITANRAGQSVVVVDYADNIRRIRALLARIDRDGTATRVIALKNAGAREIAASLAQLVGPAAEGAPAQAAIVPIDSSNAVALRGDPTTVARLAAIVEDLDRRAASATEIRVHFLEHADADKLVPVLQQLAGQQLSAAPVASAQPASAKTAGEAASASASTIASGGKASATIVRYEGANALVISAPADVQRTLGEVVRQLDQRREQVLVEAIIVEISDNAAKKLGVQFLLGGLPGSGVPFAATNYSNAAPNIQTIAGAVGARELNTTTTTVNGNTTTTTTNNAISDQLAQAAVNSVLGAGGAFAGFADKIGNNAVFGAIINAVKSDTQSNILSTPSVMTLDNQEARLLVGQEIPVTTGEALSQNFDNAFRTVQRQNVGIQLEVKPQINAGGAIKLFLRQEVSSIAGPVSSNFNDLILNKREIETTVTVDDGQIIALGGLLDDNERRTIEKVPLLGDIPGIGELFRSRAKSRTKTNLMVFIRPTIIRSKEDAQALAARRYDYVRNQQWAQRQDREPTIDELVRDYLGTGAPVAPAISQVPQKPDVIVPQMRESQQRVYTAPVRPSDAGK
jgi:general secretion pathway protein D